MDRNEGRLPPSAPPVITAGHPSYNLSPEELKDFFAKQKAQKLAEKVIFGDEQVLINDTTFKELPDFSVKKPVKDFDIFDVSPPLQPVEGGGSVKGGKRNS
jgi:hypothetical protein